MIDRDSNFRRGDECVLAVGMPPAKADAILAWVQAPSFPRPCGPAPVE
jgi:hypothetical protein